MCDVADGRWDVFDCRRVKARKQHECEACDDGIQRGHVYFKTFALIDGGVSTWKHCARCHVLYEKLCELHNQSDPIYVDERLNCGTSWREAFGEDPPDEIAALAFILTDDAQKLVGAQ